ncbi:MAG: DUF1599 domain-containing protein [Bacteroidota bacterium]|nr:DUF1599 domain-containing protein [Bacteroidota bacterium]
MNQTSTEYSKIIDYCRNLYIAKNQDYGTSWRILRPSSITDQIYIKALRIRTLQENGYSKINEDENIEFVGIINYSVMAIIQLESQITDEISSEEAVTLYDNIIQSTKKLMQDKNHDYGEAWRLLRISSITDLILQKLLRVKQIEDNKGKTIVSEGLIANFQDIINYSVFALILSGFQINE